MNRLLVAGAFIIRDGKLLLALKDSGSYSLIGGKVEMGESVHQGLIREIYEETGLRVQESQLQLMHVISFKREDGIEMTSFDFLVNNFQGEPINMEPDKHVRLDWVALDALPENLLERHKKALTLFNQNIYYSHYGW